MRRPDHGPWFHPSESRAVRPHAFPEQMAPGTGHIIFLGLFQDPLNHGFWQQRWSHSLSGSSERRKRTGPLTCYQATTSPEVLSRFGAMESISSMKMIAGEFFLSMRFRPPRNIHSLASTREQTTLCHDRSHWQKRFAMHEIGFRYQSNKNALTPKQWMSDAPWKLSDYMLLGPSSASSNAFRRLDSASPAIFDMISGPLMRKKKAPVTAAEEQLPWEPHDKFARSLFRWRWPSQSGSFHYLQTTSSLMND